MVERIKYEIVPTASKQLGRYNHSEYPKGLKIAYEVNEKVKIVTKIKANEIHQLALALMYSKRQNAGTLEIFCL